MAASGGRTPNPHLVPDLPVHQVFLHLEGLKRGLLHGALQWRPWSAAARGLAFPGARAGGKPTMCSESFREDLSVSEGT